MTTWRCGDEFGGASGGRKYSKDVALDDESYSERVPSQATKIESAA